MNPLEGDMCERVALVLNLDVVLFRDARIPDASRNHLDLSLWIHSRSNVRTLSREGRDRVRSRDSIGRCIVDRVLPVSFFSFPRHP